MNDESVTVEIEVAAKPERVFQALTDGKQLFEWWGKEPSVVLTSFDMDARPGGSWRFTCKPTPGSKHNVEEGLQEFVAHGEILEYDPPRLLVWTWIANWHENPTHPTTVKWELSPTETGTLVRVTHSGLEQEPVARKDYGKGWQGVLRLLKEFVDRAV